MRLDTQALNTLADDLKIEEDNLTTLVKMIRTEEVTGAVVFRDAAKLFLGHLRRFRQATNMEVRSRCLGG